MKLRSRWFSSSTRVVAPNMRIIKEGKKKKRGKEIYAQADGQHIHCPATKARKVSGTCRCTTWRWFRMAWLYDATFTRHKFTCHQNVQEHRQRKDRDRRTDGNLRRVQCFPCTTRSLRHTNGCNCPLGGKRRGQSTPFSVVMGERTHRLSLDIKGAPVKRLRGQTVEN